MSSGHVEQSEEAAAVLRMAFAFVISQALYVAADLGIADHLAHGSLKVEDLASKLHLHPGALARLLQALVAFGILKRDGVRFGLSPTGQLLRSNSPRSLRSTVRFLVGPWAWRAFEQLGYSVRTGQPSFDHVWGMSNFEYWERNPDVSTIHDDAMTGLTATETARVLDAYDFSPFHTVVDVGGGNGALLAAILRQQPAATAILTDLPHVVELAYSLLEEAGVAARCEVVGGIFLKRYLPAATFIFSSTSSTIGMRAIFHDIEELQSRHGVTFASLDHRPRAA
ncbi:MAG: methyltransferase [Candidatus Cybelea sp.]